MKEAAHVSIMPSAPPFPGAKPKAPEWREMLQTAPNVSAVNAIMRDYVLTLQFVHALLPRECREELAGELDVHAAAVTLLRAEMHFQGPDEGRALLHEAAHMFASAAVRITQLHPHPKT